MTQEELDNLKPGDKIQVTETYTFKSKTFSQVITEEGRRLGIIFPLDGWKLMEKVDDKRLA